MLISLAPAVVALGALAWAVLRDRRTDVRQRLTDIENGINQRLERIESDVKDLSGEVRKLADRVGDVETRLAVVETRVGDSRAGARPKVRQRLTIFSCFVYYRNMDTEFDPLAVEDAASTFAALGSEQRLAVLSTLVSAGPAGIPSGTLGERSGVTGSTLTHHVRVLTQAGLVHRVKRGRSVICAAAAYPKVRALSAYLLSECCASAESECCSSAPSECCTSGQCECCAGDALPAAQAGHA